MRQRQLPCSEGGGSSLAPATGRGRGHERRRRRPAVAVGMRGGGGDPRPAGCAPAAPSLAGTAARTRCPVPAERGEDVGADTDLALPEDAWSHLVFGFQNLSMNPVPRENGRNATYVVTLDVDGARDSTLDFFDKVEWNDGPLHLFKDPDRPGARGALMDLKVHPHAISRADARGLYAEALKSERPDFSRTTLVPDQRAQQEKSDPDLAAVAQRDAARAPALDASSRGIAASPRAVLLHVSSPPCTVPRALFSALSTR